MGFPLPKRKCFGALALTKKRKHTGLQRLVLSSLQQLIQFLSIWKYYSLWKFKKTYLYKWFELGFNILNFVFTLSFPLKSLQWIISSVGQVCVSLTERYRIGKKQKLWSQIYIKRTRSNDDESRKHPLKYFFLECHIWWEINNLTSRLEFIAQWAIYSFSFWHRCNAKFVIFFPPFSRDPDSRSFSNFYRFVSVCMVDYIKCSHCQQLFC